MIHVTGQRHIWAVGLFLVGVVGLHAAPVVQDVEVRHEGMGRTDSEFVLAHTRVRSGQELNAPAVSRDVKLLLETGQFSAVDATIEELDGGVKLVFTVKSKLRLVGDPKILGVTKFRQSKIRKWLALKDGDLIDDQAVGVAVHNEPGLDGSCNLPLFTSKLNIR